MGDPPEHAFTAVDDQADPSAWIDVLDRVRQEPAYAAYKQRLAELLEPAPGATYLEVGCGTGQDALTLASRFGVTVAGVDLSRAMVAEARRRGLSEAHVASADALPFEDVSFEGCWADRVLRFRADHLLRNGTIAHRAGGLLAEAGLRDVVVEAAPVVLRDPAALDNAMGLRTWAAVAEERGLLPAGAGEAWDRELDAAVAGNRFLYAFTVFLTAGTVP